MQRVASTLFESAWRALLPAAAFVLIRLARVHPGRSLAFGEEGVMTLLIFITSAVFIWFSRRERLGKGKPAEMRPPLWLSMVLFVVVLSWDW